MPPPSWFCCPEGSTLIRRARAGCPTTRRSCCSSEPPRCASTVARSLFPAVRTTRGGLPGAHRTAGGAGGTGLDPDGVRVLANLPSFSTLPSLFEVVPVLSYWGVRARVGGRSGETAHVARVRVANYFRPGQPLPGAPRLPGRPRVSGAGVPRRRDAGVGLHRRAVRRDQQSVSMDVPWNTDDDAAPRRGDRVGSL